MKRFEKVFIIGTGLIGASLGMNLVSRRLAREVIAVGRSAANLKIAKQRRCAHQSWTVKSFDALFDSERINGADLIILAMPVRGIVSFIEALPVSTLKRLAPDCIMTDVGSTKASIVRAAQKKIKQYAFFVGAHPIAGTEKTGAGAAMKDLFRAKTVIVTPHTGLPQKHLRRITALWRACGASVETMTPRSHDRLLAALSHLPHMAAFALVDAVGPLPLSTGLAAGGFRDMTRVASSDAVMWKDICIENGDNLIKMMKQLSQSWRRLQKAIEKKDQNALLRYFERSRRLRHSLESL
jgi:prephenate dehydrogenase